MKHGRPSGTLRIIGGNWRGRKIRVSRVHGLRPTLDRVRETLFNWLAADIRDAHCLDLFAGTGALSFEALSRGASDVVAVERNNRTLRDLHQNRSLLGANRLSIIHTDALRYVDARHPRTFDIIFVDPPFHHQLIPATLEALARSDCVTHGTLVYVELEADTDCAVASSWDRLRHQRAGNTQAMLLEWLCCRAS
ncbi:MAG: 16S rRNA (guanine(966)-N(2))-methyltransferase RsmD [Pseudomonadales bacterium]